MDVTPPPQVTVVVLNYNKHDDLYRNLSRLREIPFASLEVIVVDNFSEDGSAEMVRTQFPQFRLIVSEVNGGVCRGRNLGFRAARGEFIIYLDDDSVAPMNICAETVRLFGEHPDVGCLAFLVRQMPSEVFANLSETTRLANYHGAGHAFRRELLAEIDYLDENFFFGGEELDSSLALHDLGYGVRYTPEVVIDHYVREHKGDEFFRRLSNTLASLGWFYLKWFPIHLALLFTSRMIVSMFGTAVRRGAVLAVVRGLALYLRGVPRIWRSRRVALPATVEFYTSPYVQPPHFAVPLWRKLLRKLGATSLVPL